MSIGKIVKSDSHINYVCQIHGPHEVESQPAPADYAFGRFVRIPIRTEQSEEDPFLDKAPGLTLIPRTYAIGVIYDTILQNPAFGVLGPRLSNETQVELFSPDYMNEKAVLIYVMVLGMLEQRPTPSGGNETLTVSQGVPPLALELDSEIETLTDEQLRAFHFFANQPEQAPFFHMEYLPSIMAQRNSLLPMVSLPILAHLEKLFPEQQRKIQAVRKKFMWDAQVETMR